MVKPKYYVLTEQSGNSASRIVNWYGSMDIRKMNREQYKELPDFFLLDMRVETDVFYPDILLSPVLMVSEAAMAVIGMYDQEMPFRFAALFDSGKEECAQYYCPILENDDREGREVLFHQETKTDPVVMIRDDLAESLLIRGAAGFSLEELNEAKKSSTRK